MPQRNLSLHANRLAKAGGRRIPESVLERDYCLAWSVSPSTARRTPIPLCTTPPHCSRSMALVEHGGACWKASPYLT